MKSLLACMLLFLFGCKEGSPSDNASKQPDQPLIKTAGCTITKNHGVISIDCADGSNASFNEPVTTVASSGLSIKDATGTSYANLKYVTSISSTHTLLNTTSGHVLSYDNNGNITTATATFYETNNCTGVAYAYPSSGAFIKNRVLANNNAWPTSTDALKIVGYNNGTINMLTRFSNGACSANVGTSTQLPIVEPSTLDSSDPLTLDLPLELVAE